MILKLYRTIFLTALLLIQNFVQPICCSRLNNPGGVLLEAFLRPFTPNQRSVAPHCYFHSQLYLEALANHTLWAFNMYDSSTKVPSGIMTGNTMQLGNYDQCVNIRASSSKNHEDNQEDIFTGQHCVASLKIKIETNGVKTIYPGPLNMKNILLAVAATSGNKVLPKKISAKYRWAVCVPSSCSALDVETTLREMLSDSVGVVVTVTDNNCWTLKKSSRDLTVADVTFICVIFVFAFLVVCSTAYDCFISRQIRSKCGQKKKQIDVLLSFSLYRNIANLIKTKLPKDSLECLNGIRFLTICWIIYGHTFYLSTVKPALNSSDVLTFRFDWTKIIVMNGTLSTDTFFLLSGILLSYVFTKEMTQTSSFNVAKFYIYRYIRVTPPMAMTIFFYATLFDRLGSGPLWNTWVGKNHDNCVNNWWSNLIYINNYVDISHMCLDQTWYLAADMQLLWFSPIVIYPMWRWPALGKFVWMVSFCGSIIAPFIVTYIMRLPGAMLYKTDDTMVGQVFVNIYTRTYNRAGPFLIGIALGYILHLARNKPFTLSKTIVVLGWICSTILCMVTFFGVYPMYQPTYKYNVIEASSYAALHRSVWAVGISWIIFASVQGYGGPVNKILSCKIFIPLSRLSYAAYLCHYIVLLYYAGTARTPAVISTYNIVLQFFGNVVIIFVLALLISLAFETPFVVLCVLMRRRNVLECRIQNVDNRNIINAEISSKGSDTLRGMAIVCISTFEKKSRSQISTSI